MEVKSECTHWQTVTNMYSYLEQSTTFKFFSYLFLSSVFYDSTSLHEITEEKMSCVLIVLFLPMCFFFKLCISMDKTLEHECLNSEFLNVVARNFCFNHF